MEAVEGFGDFKIAVGGGRQVIRTVKYADDLLVLRTKDEAVLHVMIDKSN